jgi:hypothetical protein
MIAQQSLFGGRAVEQEPVQRGLLAADVGARP